MRLGEIQADAVSFGKKGFSNGIGVAAGIVGTDWLLSRVLVKNGAPMVPANLGPLAIAGLGVAGAIALNNVPVVSKLSKWIDPTDFAAGAIGVALAGYIGKFLSPAMDATSNVASVPASNASTSGFGFGRAFSRSLAGLGNLPMRRSLYSPGARSLSGAAVQFRDTTGRRGLAGANVRFVAPRPNLAGMIS